MIRCAGTTDRLTRGCNGYGLIEKGMKCEQQEETVTVVLKRKDRDATPQMIPQPVPGKPGLVQVDSTWGKIQPMQVAEGVRTIGELEMVEHLEQGLPVVDARTHDFYEQSTIPGATNIPYAGVEAHVETLDRGQPTVFFCNGPQCPQSPTAIRALLEASYPAEQILYYRGGLHDWLTLGLPVMPGEEQG